jgi:hypothetical protein
MLAPLALSAALFALPGLASAGAVTSATAVALFEPVDADPGIDRDLRVQHGRHRQRH